MLTGYVEQCAACFNFASFMRLQAFEEATREILGKIRQGVFDDNKVCTSYAESVSDTDEYQSNPSHLGSSLLAHVTTPTLFNWRRPNVAGDAAKSVPGLIRM